MRALVLLMELVMTSAYKSIGELLYQDYSVHVSRNSSEVINGIVIKTSTVISGVDAHPNDDQLLHNNGRHCRGVVLYKPPGGYDRFSWLRFSLWYCYFSHQGENKQKQQNNSG